MQKLWIDTDTGSDDAVALVMALRSDKVKVEGISVVAGNTGLDQCVQNALYTVELCGADVPVYAGLAKPIMRPAEDAEFVHGEDGMGDIGLDLKGRTPAPGHGVDAMIEYICSEAAKGGGETAKGEGSGSGKKGEREKARLLTLGPLSNIATALLRAPEMAEAVEHCYIMGGAITARGNITEVAEFNIWNDPEAAHIVFESGMPITLVGWEACMESAFMDPEKVKEVRALGTPYADFAMDIQEKLDEFMGSFVGKEGYDLPDPLAAAVAIDPSIAEMQESHVRVVTGDGITRGQTVVDHLDVLRKPPNARLVTYVDPKVFLNMLKELLS